GAGDVCACSAKKDDYPLLADDPTFKDECDAVCGTYAVKDLDCPDAGCLGFGVTLPDGFDIDSTPIPTPQPTPSCFPTSDAWTKPGFVAATQAVAGKQCTYTPPLPAGKFCQ
ncbi:MAG TPA: hypothetical protein VMT58_08640, partial [Candidatus Binataceae bacterium]|nr:hypothetical protein [Candidatus Binataceae bacterium]